MPISLPFLSYSFILVLLTNEPVSSVPSLLSDEPGPPNSLTFSAEWIGSYLEAILSKFQEFADGWMDGLT